MEKLNVGFICIHNSCRSQMAEAIARLKYGDKINVFSAGTEISRGINKDAIRIIEYKYGVNMIDSQKPKLIDDVPFLNVVISMGCDVVCPVVPNQHLEDWDLDDPTGLSDQVYYAVINKIENNLQKLIKTLSI